LFFDFWFVFFNFLIFVLWFLFCFVFGFFIFLRCNNEFQQIFLTNFLVAVA